MFPDKLKIGDEIRVVAPSRSLKLISEENTNVAIKALEEMGLKITFSKNALECDEFISSSIESRISDLHEAFLDKNVKGILTVIGGHNSNQLLDYIDFDIIKNNPKILCGFSDITALASAIYKMTGVVTYSGPHFSTFGMQKGIEYTKEYFKKCLMENESIEIKPSLEWSDDAWFLDQEKRVFIENTGYHIINEGKGFGEIVGGNLCTLNLLQGTKYMPSIEKKILFIEDDCLSSVEEFDRNFQSLVHLEGFDRVKGIIIGRFQVSTDMKMETLEKLVKNKVKLNIPIVANVDFGHTTPQITFPIGGSVKINASNKVASIIIERH